MSLPPFAAFRSLGELPDRVRLAAQVPRQLLRFWYVMYFQLPLLPELSAFRVVAPLWRQWSPGYDQEEDVRFVQDAIGSPENWRAAIGIYRAVIRGSKPPAEYAELDPWFLNRRCYPRCTCTGTTTVAWHRITSPGSSGSSRRAVTRSSSRAPGTSCNSSSRMWWQRTSSTSSGKPDSGSMTVRRLTPVDAQMYWMSAKIPNDQFLLYGFAGVPANLDQAIGAIRARAGECPELCLRLHDDNVLTYPAWVSGQADPAQVVVHELDDNSWAGCLAAVSALADDQLDQRVSPWRLHVFSAVDGIPTTSGRGDGRRAADRARVRRRRPVVGVGGDAVRSRSRCPAGDTAGGAGHHAAVAQLCGRTGASAVGARRRGRLGARAGGVAARLRSNARPTGARTVRTPGPAPRQIARPDSDDRCAVRGLHGAVRSSARPGRRPVDAGGRGADGESRCPRSA